MKRLRILLALFFLLAANNIYAAETEPNNTKAQANTLALNGNNSGAISVSGDEDWWKVTTTADGKLNVSFTVSNAKTLRCYVYDNNGTTVLNSDYSSSGATVSTDGLAAGTYYIKLIAYTAGQLPAYTISNTLTLPAQANDTEPDNSRAQAIALPLNGSKAGHSGYYYNLYRDTADWYKVTTNADGLLRVTLKSGNGNSMRVYLYDNNGTTLLGSDYSGSSAVINADGLAAGTYYIKVFCYYNTQFAPYMLLDSLFVPAQANDTEPNNSRAQAVSINVNSSKTGHAGYYYNVYRDTADWYKLTTTTDGSLRVTLKSGNGNSMRVYLYDNDGTTLLKSDYSGSAAIINQDGLAAGTYYIKVFCYYNTQFAPYTLSDSLFTYTYIADKEPNKYASQAKTMLSNKSTSGHTGFYYNNSRDTADWWKINYTGTNGNLSLTINQETLFEGGTNSLRFQVYKDTLAAPIHSSYSSAASRQVDLTGLTQGYYWLKVYPYYNTEFSSYSIINTFTQVNIAAIKINSYYTADDCTATNSISVKCTNSKAPYTIQLYHFDTAYGNPVSTKTTYTFKNLPAGSYYVTAYGDGATDAAFGKTKVISIEPKPTGLSTTNIQSTQSKLNWAAVTCADYFTIQYKKSGTTKWNNKNTTGNVSTYILTGLTANTQYVWRIATADSANGITATGAYSDSITFKTTASFVADTDNTEDALSINSSKSIVEIAAAPNPAINYFTIRYQNSTKEQVSATLYNSTGKTVWTSGLVNADALNGKQVIVSQFASGLYYLKIINSNGVVGNIKIAVVK